MSFPKYPKYKNSGVEWLGDVPEHWEVRRLGTLFRQAIESGVDELPILSVSIHHGVSDREFDEEELDRKVTRSDERSKYRKVEPGDLVYNMMRAWQGGFGSVSVMGMVSPAYIVARPIKEFSTPFIEQLLRTPQAIEQMRRHSQGVTDFRLRLYWEEFKSMRVVVPPNDEQTSVATFIKQQSAKIDALIAEQRRLIELLKEKRQAVISHAVTKGLNPDAPMKPSGIEWLGDVPEHWSVAAVRFRYTVQLGKMLDTEKITGKHLQPYLRVFDVQWGAINVEELPQMDFDPSVRDRFRLAPGDLLINEGGSYPGRSAIWNGELEECYFQKALHRLRPCDATTDTTRFFFYTMAWATARGVFTAGGNESTIEHLPAEKFRKYRFAFPPISEQFAIADFLDNELGNFETLTTEATSAIALLQERRTALISAAVTGKIDVREFANVEAA